MRGARQTAKWALIGAAGLLAVLALVLIGRLAWLRSDSGHDWLARQIEDAASTPGSLEVAIGGIGGALPHSLSAHDVVVSDAEGPFLAVDSLEIEWDPWALLNRTLAVRRITLGTIDLARLPAAAPARAEENGTTTPRDLLDFPLKVRLDRLSAEEIVLVAGNHDQSIEAWGMPNGLRCHYLQDDGIELFGLRLWGTPWQPWFLDWAFNAPRRNGEEFLASKFDLVPEDTDVVVGHGPPRGYGDAALRPGGHEHVGSIAMTEALDEKIRERILDRIPLKRMGSPDEIAAAVSFLASERAGYLTGQILGVNGGMYM